MVDEVLIGSSNSGKQAEISALLEEYGVRLWTPQQLGLTIQIGETGVDYQQNARLKALGYAHASGRWTIADDTGLEVIALGGAPGLHSARFGPSAAERRAKLVRLLHVHPRPWRARFRAVVALASPDGQVEYGFGECGGEIIPEGRGQGGFGYDAIFQVEGTGRTLAELDMRAKNQVSHRAQAVRDLLPTLRKMLNPSGG